MRWVGLASRPGCGMEEWDERRWELAGGDWPCSQSNLRPRPRSAAEKRMEECHGGWTGPMRNHLCRAGGAVHTARAQSCDV